MKPRIATLTSSIILAVAAAAAGQGLPFLGTIPSGNYATTGIGGGTNPFTAGVGVYHVTGVINVTDLDELCVPGGVVLKFDGPLSGICVEGTLKIDATDSGAHSLLTSINDSSGAAGGDTAGNGQMPTSCDWAGIEVKPGGDLEFNGVQMNGQKIRFAKHPILGGAIVLRPDADAEIDKLLFENCGGAGVRVVDGAPSPTAVITDCGFDDVAQSFRNVPLRMLEQFLGHVSVGPVADTSISVSSETVTGTAPVTITRANTLDENGEVRVTQDLEFDEAPTGFEDVDLQIAEDAILKNSGDLTFTDTVLTAADPATTWGGLVTEPGSNTELVNVRIEKTAPVVAISEGTITYNGGNFTASSVLVTESAGSGFVSSSTAAGEINAAGLYIAHTQAPPVRLATLEQWTGFDGVFTDAVTVPDTRVWFDSAGPGFGEVTLTDASNPSGAFFFPDGITIDTGDTLNIGGDVQIQLGATESIVSREGGELFIDASPNPVQISLDEFEIDPAARIGGVQILETAGITDIRGLEISDAGHNGAAALDLKTFNLAVVRDIVVRDPFGVGIFMGGIHLAIFNAIVANAGGAGIVLGDGVSTVKNSLVIGSQGDGIVQLPVSTFAEISETASIQNVGDNYGGALSATAIQFSLGDDPSDPVSLIADPLLFDPTNGDFRPTAASPLIGAGDPAAITVDTDINGIPRVLDGTLSGDYIVDIGPFEFSQWSVNSSAGATVIGGETLTYSVDGPPGTAVFVAGFEDGTHEVFGVGTLLIGEPNNLVPLGTVATGPGHELSVVVPNLAVIDDLGFAVQPLVVPEFDPTMGNFLQQRRHTIDIPIAPPSPDCP